MTAPDDKWRVSLEGDTVVVVEPDGTTTEAPFEELDLIHITTNDRGPFAADVWWVMEDAGEIILGAFPQGAVGEQAIIDWMMALPGFDHQKMIDAMGSTDNARFVVWRRG